jgi:acyl-CoA dehydrogenase family protein 9
MASNSSNSNKKELHSIAQDLFFGVVNEEDIFPFPHPTSEQVETGTAMVEAVKKFAEDAFESAKYDVEGKIPENILKGLGELGLFGLAVEEQFGGLNLDYGLYARVFSEIAGYDGSIATTLGAHQSIGFKALLNEGTPEQKKKWLPKLASGEALASFCLTEPGSGSDAYSIKTKATKNADGTYTINGQKLWITNAGSADFYSVFCKTDHEVDGKKVEKISCFIVEKSFPGVSFGNKEDKMGIRASETRAVFFDNVKVPAENLIGELGKGFKIAMNVLNTGRLSLGSGSVGGMKTAISLATNHAKTRKQFGQSISNYGMIQEKLATMAANIYASESLVYFTTGRMNQGQSEFSLESAICKVYCSEKLWETVDKSLQIAAGNGYMREYPYERMMRDARINLIFEGTNEILRVYIALTGMKEPSDKLVELGKVADVSQVLNDPIKSLGVLSNFAKGRISKMIGTKTFTKIHADLNDDGEKLMSLINEFSIKVENTIIRLGKKIIGNEMPQMRIANMCIELFVQIAVLSRTTSILNNSSVSESDKNYVKSITTLVCSKSRESFLANSRRLGSDFDKSIPSLSQQVAERDGYGLDILKF